MIPTWYRLYDRLLDLFSNDLLCFSIRSILILELDKALFRIFLYLTYKYDLSLVCVEPKIDRFTTDQRLGGMVVSMKSPEIEVVEARLRLERPEKLSTSVGDQFNKSLPLFIICCDGTCKMDSISEVVNSVPTSDERVGSRCCNSSCDRKFGIDADIFGVGGFDGVIGSRNDLNWGTVYRGLCFWQVPVDV